MIRFLHVADVHLGASYAAFGPLAEARRQEVLDAFRNLPQVAETERVHAVLIAGDLFDGPRPTDYTLAVVRQTRVGETGVPKFIREWLSWGAGPRAVQYLILGAKARALLHGRVHVQTDDVQTLAYPVLRHRILTNFTAASEGITSDSVVKRLLEETPDKDSDLQKDERFRKIFAS